VCKFSLALSVLAVTPLVRADEPFHFENQIEPLLSRHGCNS
jgi:hypothetical protein